MILQGREWPRQEPYGRRHRLPCYTAWLYCSLRHRRRADRELARGQSARQTARGTLSLPVAARSGHRRSRLPILRPGRRQRPVPYIVNDRHQRRRPMLFATNKPPLTAWGDIPHDHDLAEAIVDSRARTRSSAVARWPILMFNSIGHDARATKSSPVGHGESSVLKSRSRFGNKRHLVTKT